MTSCVQSSKNNEGSLKKGGYLLIIDKQITPFFQETLHFLFIILKWDIGDFYLSPLLQDKTACTLIFFAENIFQLFVKIYLDLGYVHTMHAELESFLWWHKSYPV